MEYLANPVCKLKPLFDFNPSVKTNIITTCFFRMANHYKSADLYIEGLKSWARYMNGTRYNYKFRIFIDHRVAADGAIMSIIKSCPKMQPVLFTCAKFMSSNYHIQVFGALLRYFPFFDFPNNDAAKVLVVDVDYSPIDLKIDRTDDVLKYAETHDEPIYHAKLNTIYTQFYPGLPNQVGHVFSDLVMLNKKYDNSILLDFIAKAPQIKDKGFYDKRVDAFGYGTDELFLNKYFLNFIDEPYVNIVGVFDPSHFLWHVNHKKLFTNKAAVSAVYRKILGTYYTAGMSMKDMEAFLDSVFYENYNVSDRHRHVAKNIYSVLSEMVRTGQYLLKPQLVKFILDNFAGDIYRLIIYRWSVRSMKTVSIYKGKCLA